MRASERKKGTKVTSRHHNHLQGLQGTVPNRENIQCAAAIVWRRTPCRCPESEVRMGRLIGKRRESMGRYATTGLWSSEGFLIKWPESVFEPLACFTFCTCCLQSSPPLRPYVARLACYLNHCNFSPWLQLQTVQINRSWIPVIYVHFHHFFLVAESKTANENNFRVSVRNIFVTAEANNPNANGKYKQWIIAFFFFSTPDFWRSS